MPRLAALSLAVASLSLAASPARAAGLYFSDRGVRPLSRGGAFIAGADDLGAIAYNPAGLYDAGSAFLFDASWLHFTAEYSRQAILRQVDPNTGTGLELNTIAAVVVGGVAISGGRGTLLGAFVGLLLLACISPALTHLHVAAYWEKAIQGAIILLAVVADGLRNRNKRF